jgi:hypothetical protein
MRNTLLLSLAMILGYSSLAQENYSVNLIPDELKENANAVIRMHNTSVEVVALDQMIISEYRVVTILNRFGDQHSGTQESYDDSSRSILKISAIVLDSEGEVVKKYKKSDFKDVSAVSNGQMYMDDRVKYLDYKPSTYPYTIIFESKVKEKSTAHLNSWFPIQGYYISVEESTYKLVNQTSSEYKFKHYNTTGYDFSLREEKDELFFVAENLKAIEKESMSPDFLEVMPWIRVALNEFELKGKYGACNDWKEFGLWQYNKLLSERDVIDEDTKQIISNLVIGATTEKEKVKRIYKYMQDNTRYVGVQLGIGGWQPIKASEVDRVKYGDCKGLTNYTKALLKSQNIDAYYTVVFSGDSKKNIDESFASLQGDHVFLNVPLENETIWLECTNQTIPFGFLGDFTDDRDVLVIKPTGGEIVHTPVYDEFINTYSASATISLDIKGEMVTDFKSESKGLQYYYQSYKERLKPNELEERYLNTWNYLNGITLLEKKIVLDKENIVFNEDLKISVSNYVTKAGKKLLVPINPFNRLTNVPIKYSDRKLPFKTGRSITDNDTYRFTIPNGYTIEIIPENYELSSEFGEYKIVINKVDNTTVKYQRKLILKEGVFPKEKYKSYRGFIKKIIEKDKSKFILTKKES